MTPWLVQAQRLACVQTAVLAAMLGVTSAMAAPGSPSFPLPAGSPFPGELGQGADCPLGDHGEGGSRSLHASVTQFQGVKLVRKQSAAE